jgi:hypothetical protein
LVKIVLSEIACWLLIGGAVAFMFWRLLSVLASVNLRITQLAGAVVAPPKAPHPYDCPHCGERFKQRSWKPTEGERGYCGRCMVWHQVFPPIDAPGGS